MAQPQIISVENQIVTVEGSSLSIDHMITSDLDVVRVAQKATPEDLPGTVEAMLKIGATAISRAQHVNDFEFVRVLADDIVKKAGARAQEILAETSTALEEQLNGEDGALLEPVRRQLHSVQQVVETRLADVRKQLDPNNPESDLYGALKNVRRLLDPKNTESLPVRIEQLLDGVVAKDGALARSVKAVVSESLNSQIEPLRKQIEGLEKEVLKEKAVAESAAEILQMSTQKGYDFEADVITRVKAWATVVGGETHHVGPENKPGDIVVVFTTKSSLGVDLRIVIEAKDDASARGRKRIQDDMAKAMDHRECEVGIFVGKTLGAFGKEIGEFDEGTADNRPWIACTVEYLTFALRTAIVAKRWQDRVAKDASIDPAVIEDQLQAIRTSVRRITSIKTAATAITKSAGQVTSESEQLQREIEGALRVIEGMLET